MTVVIKPTPEKVGKNADEFVTSSQALLDVTSTACSASAIGSLLNSFPGSFNQAIQPERCPILVSSFDSDFPGNIHLKPVIPYGNGFVEGIIRAFQQDLHLVLRPDDVWLAILTQFNNYVNANVESLRDRVVAHEGMKEVVFDSNSRPCEGFFPQMTSLMAEKIIDDELRDWIMPDFTTTSDNDKWVASIVMMGTLQKYFRYVQFYRNCGFPSVTLLGESEDWLKIFRRVEKLPRYGVQPDAWSKQLIPIIRRMVASFFLPDSPEIKEFWLQACHSNGVDENGTRARLSGWITAFCFWTEKGTCLDPNLQPNPAVLSDVRGEKDKNLYKECVLELDGIKFHHIDFGISPYNASSIPRGVVSLPCTVRDEHTGVVRQVTIVAGSVGMTPYHGFNVGEDVTSVCPSSGWWMLYNSAKKV